MICCECEMTTTVVKKMDQRLNAAVVDLLYRLGDDSLIIGHRNSEWTGIGPILEEDIAFSSMAQDKMGHALAFYNLLHELGEPTADELAFARGPAEFRCCSLAALSVFPTGGTPVPHVDLANNPVRDRLMESGDWALSLVRQYLYSEADAVRMAAMEGSAYSPLSHLARKLRGEIKYHTLHGRTLMTRLGKATDDSRARLQAALDALYPHALGMFEPTEFDEALAKAGVCPHEDELKRQWLAVIAPMIEEVGLELPENAKPVYGGRHGNHPPELATLLEEMQNVYRLDPGAEW
jgi:ring-1,2-phenylacetyl-CoA epoxidase subunit PaaC